MVKLFKRSNGILYLEYRIDGKSIQRSTRLKDTPENRKMIKKEVIPHLERKIVMGDIRSNKPKEFKYYSEILLKEKSHLKSYRDIKRAIETISDTFGDKKINTITRGMVKAWVQKRLTINSPKTVKEYMTQMRGIFNAAVDLEDITQNPAENIKLPPHRKSQVEPFSAEEVKAILDTSTGWMQLFLSISFYTGMRTGEVLALQYADIDIKNRTISITKSMHGTLTTPKTESSIREVPILDDLIPYLKNLPKSIWIMPKKKGGPYVCFPGQKKEEWKDLLKTCDIPYRKIYATRHTFIVSMLKHSDLSILEIAQAAGHSSTQMIIQNYGKFIKGEHLKVDRKIRLYNEKNQQIS